MRLRTIWFDWSCSNSNHCRVTDHHPADADVQCVGDDSGDSIRQLLARFGLELTLLPPGAEITGSFWGAPEAGIVNKSVFARPDTPIHSALHEAAHVICMTADRRAALKRDAGGDNLEEAAVCYLQILMAGHLSAVGGERLMRDMDAWGYSFRLGRAALWFEQDATDARDWLETAQIIDAAGEPLWTLRQ